MHSAVTWLTLSLSAFFWALMFYLGQYALAYLSPEAVGGWRFLLGGMVLLPWMLWREGPDWGGFLRNVIPLSVMAVVGIGGFNLALFHGIRHTSPMNAALIMAICPILITFLGSVLTREPVHTRQISGLIAALVGVMVVISQGDPAQLLRLSLQKGDMLILLAAACWALYATLPKRFIHDLPPTQMTAITVSMGGIVLSAYAQATKGDMLTAVPAGVAAALAVMGLFGSGVAYVWWNDAVRTVGAGIAAVFMNLVPIFTALIGVCLGQTITLPQLAGTALVLLGVWLSTSRAGADHRYTTHPTQERLV